MLLIIQRAVAGLEIERDGLMGFYGVHAGIHTDGNWCENII